jgi:4-amino-4-deoxy-L-arabinose transferase-like glycosyltransferase
VQLDSVRATGFLSKTSIRERVTWLVGIVAFGFALRLLWITVTGWRPTPDDDAYRYDLAARALVDGAGYIHIDGSPTAFWPPGYPLILATAYQFLGDQIAVAQLLNVVLGTATIALTYLIGRRTLGARPALVGAGIVALFPSLIFFTGVTLSEVTFTFLALLGMYLLLVEAQQGPERDLRLLIGAGLVLGLATLTRGQAFLLPLVMVPFWLRNGLTRPLIFERLVAIVLGIGIIVAPWTIRNAAQLGSPVFISTNAGIDLWMGHNDDANGAGGLGAGQQLVYRHPDLDPVEREVRVNAEAVRESIAFAFTHPHEEIILPFQKFFWLYYNDEEGLKWNDGHGGQHFMSSGARQSLVALSNIYYFAMLGLVALGFRRWFSLKDSGKLLLITLIAYWTLVHMVFFGDPRFHAPIMPIAALLAAPALVALWSGKEPWGRPEGPTRHPTTGSSY